MGRGPGPGGSRVKPEPERGGPAAGAGSAQAGAGSAQAGAGSGPGGSRVGPGGSGVRPGREQGRPRQEWGRARAGSPAPARSPCLASRQEDVRRGRWEQDLHGDTEALPAVQGAGEAPPGCGQDSALPDSGQVSGCLPGGPWALQTLFPGPVPNVLWKTRVARGPGLSGPSLHQVRSVTPAGCSRLMWGGGLASVGGARRLASGARSRAEAPPLLTSPAPGAHCRTDSRPLSRSHP